MAYTDEKMDKLFDQWVGEHSKDEEMKKTLMDFKYLIISFLVYFLDSIIKGK